MERETESSDRLEHFPISFFAVIMGLAGLTIAWEKAQNVFGIDLSINTSLVGFTASAFAGLAVLFGIKFIRYRGAVLKELRHPVKLNFFPTVVALLIRTGNANMRRRVCLPEQ